MAVTQAPSREACIAIVDRINSGTAYALELNAEYNRLQVDVMEEIVGLRVDVIHEDETQLNETLDIENRTSHTVAIWVRNKPETLTTDAIDAAALIVRQIYQRVNNFTSSNARVKVWEVDERTQINPDKVLLRQHGIFAATIWLRVEVEASA